MSVHRWLALGGLALALGLLAVLPARAAGQAASGRATVPVLTVNSAITPVVAEYVKHGIDEAERTGAGAVVIKLDTPGGLDTAMRTIIQRILASTVPVIVYVSPSGARAASAGAYISYAAHIAAMAPSTTIGSASPVSIGASGQVEQQSEVMTNKVTNDAVSYIRGLAERRGRNADWAEQAVRQAANLPASEALRLGVVDLIATDLDDLLRQAHGRTVTLESGPTIVQVLDAAVQPVAPTWIESFLQLIADPTIAYLLLSLGLLALYAEFANPGAILPGVAGAILVLLALFGLGSLPVNWAGALLMILAFVLLAIDLFAPTHGVLTIGGVIAFALGSMLLLNTQGNPAFEVLPGAIAAVVISLAAFAAFISVTALRDRGRQVMTGREGLIGATAIVRSRLAPQGMVFVQGELWRATSQGGPVELGQAVRVLGVRGLDLDVEVLEPQPAAAGKEEPA
ncbi:MAG: nodulation protein NfeD [Chloroflexi bacterium]|nr:nodulation protein NfeD [Chloroflexota bacterium]